MAGEDEPRQLRAETLRTMTSSIASNAEHVASHTRRLDTHSTRLTTLEKNAYEMGVWKAGYEAHASATEREMRGALDEIKTAVAAIGREVTEIRIKGAGQTAKVNVWIAGAGAIAAAALAWMLGHIR